MQCFNEICHIVKNNWASFPEFDNNYVMNAKKQGENTFQTETALRRTFVVYDDMDSAEV